MRSNDKVKAVFYRSLQHCPWSKVNAHFYFCHTSLI